jgi:hypothetical protein
VLARGLQLVGNNSEDAAITVSSDRRARCGWRTWRRCRPLRRTPASRG